MRRADTFLHCAFLYAAPLRDLAFQYTALYRRALATIAPPGAVGSNESWYPVAFDTLRDDADVQAVHDYPRTYRIYKSLVLRFVLQLRLIKQAHQKRTHIDTPPELKQHYAALEQQMYHWLDAHLLLAIAIDQLGYVPDDASEAMAVLLERYAPDVHTALCENELPDLSAEVERCSFFTQSNEARKEDPLIYTISKALPHRCEVREVAVKVAEVSAYNAGYFGFIKLALVAMFLGLYRRANFRAGWRLRFAVYRLFFFSMDRRLLRFRAPKRSPSGTAQPLGGSAQSLAHDYNLNALADAILQPLSPSRRARAVSANVRLQYTHYPSIVASKYSAQLDAQRKQTTARKKSATELRNDGTRYWRTGFEPAPPPASSASSSYVPASDSLQNGEDVVRSGVMQAHGDGDPEHFAQGLYVANAMARMTYEKNCGIEFYEQRLSAGTLPDSGIVLRDGSTAPAPKPIARGTAIGYKDAYKGVLPCDRELPSEEALQRDAIVYHWMSTMMLRDKQTGARTASAKGGGADKKSVERDYIFQNAINLAVREYLIFALERWLEPLRYELCGRVAWASWEESVMIVTDGLRSRLDAVHDGPCAPGAFLTTYSVYQWITTTTRARPINNHYTAEKEPFLFALKRLMKAHINNVGFGDQRVDKVVPRETEILLQHLLQHWCYPRVCPPFDLGAVQRVDEQEQEEEHDVHDAENFVFQQFHEKVLIPQLVYLIEPVPGPKQLPPEVDPNDATAVRAYIKREFVANARFPLGIFHAHDEVLARFAACRRAYHMSPSDPVVRDFVNWLAEHSAYQFYLIRIYCKVIERYMEIHTVALPRHIALHQQRTLRAQFCVPDTERVPPHLMRSLICMGCKRCASVFPSPAQRHSSMAVGNDEVRFVAHTDDDAVRARVRQRGFRPLAYEELESADSWTEVLLHRSQPSAELYDRYCGVRESDETPAYVLDAPELHGHMPAEPTGEDLDRFARELFADTFSEENRERYAAPTDRRRRVYTEAEPEPWNLALQPVARGKGRLGELAFDADLWHEVDRRMRIFNGRGAHDEASFLLLGHAIEGADEQYASVKWSDTTQRIKAESKKTKQANAQYATIASIVDPREQERKLNAYMAKRRRDADSMERFSQCTRRRMIEIDFCGRALRASNLYLAGRAAAHPDDCILACCDCLMRIWSTQARAIADRVVCAQCYTASKHSGGSVAQRAIRGESTKSVSATTAGALNSSSANRTRTTPLQSQLSPAFSTLCNEVIPLGTCCIMDRCKTCKTDEQKMYGLEVLLDTNVGNETFAYVYFCAKHARMYSRMFRVVPKLPLSTVKMFMMQNRKDFAEVVSRGSFLDDVMRRAAHATGIGTQARAEEELKRKKRREAQTQRRQRQVAGAESQRQRAVQSSAVVVVKK